jgi:hypothetical protein
MTTKMQFHDPDCAVITVGAYGADDTRIACTCRERRAKRKAKSNSKASQGPFDGAVSLGDGNYWRRPLSKYDN